MRPANQKSFLLKTLSISLLIASVIYSLLYATDSTNQSMYPFYPSLIQWKKSDVEFKPPENCADCHAEKYEEWNGSVHSMAFQDPIYHGELNKARQSAGKDIARQCEGCHTPVGMITGEINRSDFNKLGPVASSGVSCDVCHSISGHTHWQTPYHQPENGSMILENGQNTPNGMMPVKRGPLKADENCGDEFHVCAESSLHKSTELCASCHQVNHYEVHTPLEATYMEWKNGPYAVNGITCQDCHMVELPTFMRSADHFEKPKQGDYRHYFSGANFTLYSMLQRAAERVQDETKLANAKRQYDMAVKRLQSCADIEVTPIYTNKKIEQVRIRVKNIRAGHNLPTSLTTVRQVWLELTVKDAKNKVVMESGLVTKTGELQSNTRIFNSEGMGKNLQFSYNPWEIIAFSKHDTIPPKGFKDVYFPLHVPETIQTVSVDVKLRYRIADQHLADLLLKSVPADIDLNKIYGINQVSPLPIVDMLHKQINIQNKL
ncbi:MAG: cytochrome C [Desulfobacterales bacterium]|nr:cytochrome C [Desulfobacterales bacterium]